MASDGKQAMIGSFELRICALTTNWLRSTHYSAALLPKRELCLCSFKYAAIGIALICTASEHVFKHLKYHTNPKTQIAMLRELIERQSEFLSSFCGDQRGMLVWWHQTNDLFVDTHFKCGQMVRSGAKPSMRECVQVCRCASVQVCASVCKCLGQMSVAPATCCNTFL